MKKNIALITFVIGTLSAFSLPAQAGDSCAPPQDCSKPYQTPRDVKNEQQDRQRAAAANKGIGERPTPSTGVKDSSRGGTIQK